MKIFIDTNVLLRFILADDEKSFEECQSLFQLIESGGLTPYTSTIVLMEVFFVLTSTYKVKKQSAISDIDDILNTRNLTLIEKTNFKKAIKLHKKTNIKLSDGVIISQLPKSIILCSFDKEFKKIKEVNCKTPKEILEGLKIKKSRN